MKKFLLGLVIGLLILPTVSSAQIQGDVNPNLTPACVSITHNLAYRSTGRDVFTLQDFLQNQAYLNSEPTGFFGLLTQSAVKSFQSASGILNSGYVGPITRARINALSCASNITPTPNPIPSSDGCANGAMFSSITGRACTDIPITVRGCVPGGMFSATTGEPCPNNTGNITLNSVSGPSSLEIGQTGTWRISVNAPAGSNLTYRVAWGEMDGYMGSSARPLSPDLINQTGTFSHSYSGSGTYNVRFWVYDESRPNISQAETTLTVVVKERSGIDGCAPGDMFSSTTGAPCPSRPIPIPNVSAPTVNLSVNPSLIISDGKPGTVTLSWSSRYATYCNFEKQTLATSGSMSLSLSSTATYNISCTGRGGTTSSNPVTAVFQLTGQSTIPVIANPSATIDQNSLTSSSNRPTLTGYAYNTVKPFGISISNNGGKIWGSGDIVIRNNRWSTTINQELPSGTYQVQVYSNNVLLTSGTLTINPTCSLTSNKNSYNLGETIIYSWTSQNATYAAWQQDTSGRDHLWLPGDKLSANGSQQVTASVIGNPSVTLLVGGYDNSSGTCSKTINIVSSTSNN
ncbi:MAG: hypothetical protein COX02_01670 [Candidatus Vogelbacteria bacterium CG22_combo_CG10-13_8_21_14_all_37_9]|uniref:Peptidoglycan binding-like domain-containing protein n=1 Tax=Candidatus Vogelbacteria bacterium CG22_combo_CG10-13_8_21_14_all_37_9 TaxID=1975046 RepID=A0A2H0BKH5_9BACT|nr:MAG: hypothetical protein BK005_01060 [bacterium CG10_37_50]PIP58172.1 MAG: hypothetical protein COX02_01670 [Candidatus Vogelbacteria bacterium CG22_combo_CG10-13_8_21_14_all_37_9]